MAPKRKRVGSAIFWLITFTFIVVDQTERLAAVVQLLPPGMAAYLPTIYGALGLAALLLLRSAHEDELEEVRQDLPRPRLSLTWRAALADTDVADLIVRNDGATAAYEARAIIALNDKYLIRLSPIDRIDAGGEGIAPIELDFDGPSRRCKGVDDLAAFVRKAFKWDTPAARGIKKQLDTAREFNRLTNPATAFDPRPPDVEVEFQLLYGNFDGVEYATRHRFRYFDDDSVFEIRLVR